MRLLIYILYLLTSIFIKPVFAQAPVCIQADPLKANATGLISVTDKPTSDKFTTTSACIVAPQVPFNLPNYDGLKVNFYTQSKAAFSSSTSTIRTEIGGNQVYNPSFESAGSGSTPAANWNVLFSSGTPKRSLSLQPAANGCYSLNNSNTSTQYSSVVGQDVPARVGSTYTLSGWIWRSNSAQPAQINAESVDKCVASATSVNTWQKVGCTIVAKAKPGENDTTTITIKTITGQSLTGSSEDAVYFDDIRLTAIQTNITDQPALKVDPAGSPTSATLDTYFTSTGYIAGSGNAIYNIKGDFEINGTLTGLVGTKVIFVDGEMRINKDIDYGENVSSKGLVFVVKKDIKVAKTVTKLNGIFITSSYFCSAISATTKDASSSCNDADAGVTQPLVINGSVISLDSSKPPKFVRKTTDNVAAAEQLNFEPKYLVLLKELFSTPQRFYTEVLQPVNLTSVPPPPPPGGTTPPPPPPPPPGTPTSFFTNVPDPGTTFPPPSTCPSDCIPPGQTTGYAYSGSSCVPSATCSHNYHLPTSCPSDDTCHDATTAYSGNSCVPDIDCPANYAKFSDFSSSNLEAWYPFEGGSGTDASGNGNNGTLTGGTQTQGKIGDGLSFNGTGQLSLGSNKFDNLNNATISLWFYYTGSFDTNRVLFHFIKDGSNRLPLFVSFVGGYGNKLVYENFVTGNSFALTSINTIVPNSWYHVAITCGLGGAKMYLNGALQQTNASTGCISNIAPVPDYHIGQNFTGIIDDVRVYSRALTDNEVTGLYGLRNGNGLVAWYPFEGGSGVDVSGNGTNGTVTGATSTTGKIGGALSFNGTSSFVQLPTAAYLNIKNHDFTASAWIYGNSFLSNGDNAVFGTDETTTNNGLHLVIRNGNPYMGFYGNDTGSTTSVAANTWNYIVWRYTKTGGIQDIFLNGVKIASSPNHLPFAGTGIVRIGRWAGGAYFNGIIDDAKIYSRPLLDSEIQELYSGTPLSTNNYQLSWYKFEDATGADSSGFSRNLTVNGGTIVPGKFGTAMSFSGTQNAYGDLTTYFGADNALTASAWVNITSTTNGPVFGVTSSTQTGTTSVGWNMPFLSVNGTTAYGWIWNVNGNSPLSATTSTGWHHLAITYDPAYNFGQGIERFYIDGTQVATGTGRYSPSNAQDYFTTSIGGAKPTGVNSFFNGQLDDIRAFKRMLDPGEIRALSSIPPTYNPSASDSCSSICTDSPNSFYTGLTCTKLTCPKNYPPATIVGCPANICTPGFWAYSGLSCSPDIYCPSNPQSPTWSSTNQGVYLKFDEASGTTALDSSGSNRNATISGGGSFVPGKFGNGYNFSAADSRAQLSSSISVNNIPYTIGAWVKFPLLASTGAWRTLTRGINNDHQILVRSDDHLGVYDNQTSGGFYDSGYITTSLTGWHHLAAVGAGGVTKFYIDGSYVATSNFKSNAEITFIGNCSPTCNQNWGQVDDLRIYTRELNANEVLALFNSTPANIAAAPTTDQCSTVCPISPAVPNTFYKGGDCSKVSCPNNYPPPSTCPSDSSCHGPSTATSTTSCTANDIPCPDNYKLFGTWSSSNKVGHWNLDSNANDDSGNAYHGVLVNSPTYAAGFFGNAISLNGSNQYIELGSNTTANTAASYTGGDLTMSAWINPSTSENDGGHIFSKPWDGAGHYNYRLIYLTAGYIQLCVNNTGNYETCIGTSAIAPKGSWHHVSGVLRKNKTMEIFIDGVSQATGSHSIPSFPSPGGYQVQLGTLYPYGTGWGGNTGFSFNGLIDDARIYSRAIGPDEAKALYNLSPSRIATNETSNTSSQCTASCSTTPPTFLRGDTSCSTIGTCPSNYLLTSTCPAPGTCQAASSTITSTTCDPNATTQCSSTWYAPTWSSTAQGLWYKFDEASGNAGDSSSSGLTGTTTNTSRVSGVFGNAMQLTGSTSKVVSASTGILNTDRHTISFRMQITANPNGNWNQIFAYRAGGSDRSPAIWIHPSVNCLHWRYAPNNSGPAGCAGPSGENTAFSLNTWYHIVGIKDGGNFVFYVNGVRTESGSVDNPKTAGSAAIELGQTGYNAAPVILDDLQIYGRALNDAEVKALFNSTPSTISGAPATDQCSESCNLSPKTFWDGTNCTTQGTCPNNVALNYPNNQSTACSSDGCTSTSGGTLQTYTSGTVCSANDRNCPISSTETAQCGARTTVSSTVYYHASGCVSTGTGGTTAADTRRSYHDGASCTATTCGFPPPDAAGCPTNTCHGQYYYWDGTHCYQVSCASTIATLYPPNQSTSCPASGCETSSGNNVDAPAGGSSPVIQALYTSGTTCSNDDASCPLVTTLARCGDGCSSPTGGTQVTYHTGGPTGTCTAQGCSMTDTSGRCTNTSIGDGYGCTSVGGLAIQYHAINTCTTSTCTPIDSKSAICPSTNGTYTCYDGGNKFYHAVNSCTSLSCDTPSLYLTATCASCHTNDYWTYNGDSCSTTVKNKRCLPNAPAAYSCLSACNTDRVDRVADGSCSTKTCYGTVRCPAGDTNHTDGDCTIPADTIVNLSAESCSGRTVTDTTSPSYGAPLPDAYKAPPSTSLVAGATKITLRIASGIIKAGDEILIIKLTEYSSTPTSIPYETHTVFSTTTTIGEFNLPYTDFELERSLVNSYPSGAQVVRVPNYRNVTVNSGATMTASGWSGIAGGVLMIRATGTVTIASGAKISMNGKGYKGGAAWTAGEGLTGFASSTATCTLRNENGGGGGICASGGAGPTLNGTGSAYGLAPNISPVFGGGGGGGGYANTIGTGGNGGGILMIYADTITNSGTIDVSGSPGGNNSGVCCSTGNTGGGGGGGGYIYLNGVSGTTRGNVYVNGGAGGNGQDSCGCPGTPKPWCSTGNENDCNACDTENNLGMCHWGGANTGGAGGSGKVDCFSGNTTC